ncbi:hypothetical protein [Treponema bryantii]|uniref:hypothetical protein n=1 Tax=Treponema bryantii TaxID=163 RepID=UPI0003B49E10|nr:hypothetical protein [Treponema bryantii]
MAQKWEYTIIDLQPKSGRISDTELGKRLTDLGKEGWEIAIDRECAGYTTSIVMKRPQDEKFPKVTKEMERQAEIQINEEEWPDVVYPRK